MSLGYLAQWDYKVPCVLSQLRPLLNENVWTGRTVEDYICGTVVVV